MRTVWWIKCVLLLSLAHQGVTLGLVWISYVSQFLPLTIYNCCGCSEHQVSSLYYTPSKQNLLNGCSGILCGTTTCHEDWTSDMSARFSITWEYFVGRGTHVFFFGNDQAQFPISLENRLFRPYIHYIANFSQFLKMTDSSIHSKVPSRSLPRKCTDIPLGIKVWRETGWVKFRMSFKAMMSNIRRTHQSTWRIPKNRWSSESPFWYWPPVWVKPQVSSDGCKTLMKL